MALASTLLAWVALSFQKASVTPTRTSVNVFSIGRYQNAILINFVLGCSECLNGESHEQLVSLTFLASIPARSVLFEDVPLLRV
jgi:hypothetical protein